MNREAHEEREEREALREMEGPRPGVSGVASGLLLVAASVFGGGVLGLVIGVPVDKALTSGHGFSGLGGIVFGTPLGMIVGLVAGVVGVVRLPLAGSRLRLAAVALGVGVACILAMVFAVQTGLMDW
ncbi:hypothetical protein [Chondromyces apiculatus]|uniref:Uncharacterized protein n=1 Tax=Chondromyces apiculatus DSM 436 TaxID=1192034 RepID=A0A017SXR3_9BACT|nr:hypothetical protein [Chondromyces apiculatus]EYF01415.1 Hypothetical protein CAP_8346 [Chondromyces apiculatus DSM 436]